MTPETIATYAVTCLFLIGVAAGAARPDATAASASPEHEAAGRRAVATLRTRHGEIESARIQQGVSQVLRLWRATDGEPAELAQFLESEFLPTGSILDATFDRLEFAFERTGGYFTSLERDLRRAMDLEIGPILPVDPVLASWSPRAHVTDDLFDNRLAFTILLNFPLSTLGERLDAGPRWTRRQWAEARLTQGFSARVPAPVNQEISRAFSEAGSYIAGYNIFMHHLLTPESKRLFPEKMRLLSHWNLRDELKARYADPQGLGQQKMIATVMERIVRQEIPAGVIGSPAFDWDPSSNQIRPSTIRDLPPDPGVVSPANPADREPDTRYARLLGIFHAVRQADDHNPLNPTFMDRRFNVDREIPEAEVKALLTSVLESPLGARVGALIAKRLSRPLEPFDIWYAGFKPRGHYTEDQLDAMTKKKYPTAAAYAADIPRMLRDIGFSPEQVSLLASHIEVDPARGSGHALGANRRDDSAHLRTRVGPDGMDFKGYNIAVHEMGHNVEQVFSLNRVDHTLLQGVPNTAFTEALAFVFQSRDLQLLGLEAPDAEAVKIRALEEFWATREIAGVGLVDMATWRWMYANPAASPAQLRDAVVAIAKEIWNKHYAPIFGVRDTPLLAVYSHMIDSGLYLPDYSMGHLIAFQVEGHFASAGGSSFGSEFERLCRQGAVTPDLWMRGGVGGSLSATPLLDAAAAALGAGVGNQAKP